MRGSRLISLTLLLLSGCVAAGPGAPGRASLAPLPSRASLTPQVANPGQPVTITYAIDYPGNWSEITGLSLVGLPPSGNSAGGELPLPLPRGPGQTASADVPLPVPIRAGSYALTLKLVARGAAAAAPVGTLIVNQMPAMLSDAAVTPALHSASACSGSSMTAELSYTIESANGAAAVSEVRLLGPEPAKALPRLPSTPLDLRHPTVSAPPPTVTTVRSFPIRVLAAVPQAPQQVAAAGPVPPSGATLLLPSQRWDLARDRITTPIEMPCNLPAPTMWRLPITGVVGGALTTNTVAAQYRVEP